MEDGGRDKDRMSKEFAKIALRKIVEFEGKTLIDIFKMTEKEVAYIVTPAGRVQKVIGKPHYIPEEWLKNIDFRAAAVFHTHPYQKEAELSEGDIIASLKRSEKNTDGEGIIAENTYKYWEISKGVAKVLLDERRKIIREWDEAKTKFDKAKVAEDIASTEYYAKIVSSCISREAENLRKTENLALIEVLSGRTKDVTLEKTQLKEYTWISRRDELIKKITEKHIIDLKKKNKERFKAELIKSEADKLERGFMIFYDEKKDELYTGEEFTGERYGVPAISVLQLVSYKAIGSFHVHLTNKFPSMSDIIIHIDAKAPIIGIACAAPRTLVFYMLDMEKAEKDIKRIQRFKLFEDKINRRTTEFNRERDELVRKMEAREITDEDIAKYHELEEFEEGLIADEGKLYENTILILNYISRYTEEEEL